MIQGQVFTYGVLWKPEKQRWSVYRIKSGTSTFEDVYLTEDQLEAVGMAEKLNLQSEVVQREIMEFLLDHLFQPLIEKFGLNKEDDKQ